MQFVNDQALNLEAGPARIGPGEPGGVDHLRGPVRAVRLEPGRGVGVRTAPVELELVPGARADARHEAREVTARFGLQLDLGPLLTWAGVEQDPHALAFGRPNAEVNPF